MNEHLAYCYECGMKLFSVKEIRFLNFKNKKTVTYCPAHFEALLWDEEDKKELTIQVGSEGKK